MTQPLDVYDPPLCCPTGVCGPSTDPVLVRFAADLSWLEQQGVAVVRRNLAQEPQAFAENPVVAAALRDEGNDCLPLILSGLEVLSRGAYPERTQLARLAGLGAASTASLYSQAVEELVAIGAAIASNCEPCFKHHYDEALKLGVSREDVASAVRTATMVKRAPARAVLELAGRCLETDLAAEPPAEAPAGSCPGGPNSGAVESCCAVEEVPEGGCAPARPGPVKLDLEVAAPACDPATGCCGG